ncbi:hypothetical protein KL918_002902 [Ogataea parapolymorpha]|uniref:Putative lipoate-protein ligase A n=1 Tax=Ogataea parapolymorpha (strain ATCC 26012 / BCRC 20466 / JCM 22074 / NRRL Y-7560 / DL-1) TaxID=871575 RepID=W1QHY9_OGAPD|nr:lipoate-protein ligase A [Ogataea parapolymorpha DL-1]ESX01261.1 lipoate-protein ligase A [Ogataea parapolymorpha DL-1]KAG7867463.1 hypothetical protein KL918_002902 [Ogataea parapolymorpha]KAG7871849.1 hypothetical protein KL916_003699 [Ogataea parapolymorpha]
MIRIGGTLASRPLSRCRRLYSHTPFDEYLDFSPGKPPLEPEDPARINHDPFDFSDIPIIKDESDLLSSGLTTPSNTLLNDTNLSMSSDSVLQEPITMTTKDFMKKLNIARSDQSFDEQRLKRFSLFLHTDTQSRQYNTRLQDIATIRNPLTVISEFNNPRLNLAIEKYVYDQMPDPLGNARSRRLVLYKNSPCVVIGKNQNPFREVNFREATIRGIPILRRFSGGGTVVHDLGNFNFSYMSSRQSFSRVEFTNALNNEINQFVGLDIGYDAPKFPLTTNDRGDIVSSNSLKKVSGSAYQVSRGKSLHHGTMLLKSDLKRLSALLKLTEKRKASIQDKSTDSIPSPVENLEMSDTLFQFCAAEAFKKLHPTDGIEDMVYDNLLVQGDSHILKLNEVNDLPEEVLEIQQELSTWEWTIGKTPKFQLIVDDDEFQYQITVEKGLITEIDSAEPELEKLVGFPFSSGKISHVLAEPLRSHVMWHVDSNTNYAQLGIS